MIVLKYCFILFSVLFSTSGKCQENILFNVLSLPNGAYIVSAPNSFEVVEETSNRIGEWTKEAIIDGTSKKGWSSADNTEFPMVFVFELSETCTIEKFGFNTQCERKNKGISANDVRVEYSNTSAKTGYSTIIEPSLKNQSSTRYYDIDQTEMRWIRLTILSNHGFKTHTELMEIEAWGTYTNDDIAPIDLTGDWNSTWGVVSIRQNGSSVNGCYEYRNGIIANAGFDRRLLTFKWLEESDIDDGIGLAVLVVNEEGTRLNGIWGFGDDLNTYGKWTFTCISETPTQCYETAELVNEEERIRMNRLKQELESSGKLLIYGINFETNSADIKPESIPTLNELYELLSSNPEMIIGIVGHTDNVGSASSNLDLSARRAESVKIYLVEKGIEDSRMSTAGKGESQPIADNSTVLGRAANRRVEIILK